MKWNSNDTKYIIKKVVIYLLICFAMFIISIWNAKALNVESANYTMSKMYITNNGIQGEYQVQQLVYNGSNMQGYQSSPLQTVSKFAFEMPLGMREKLNHYEYVSFFIYNNGTSPIADINGVICEKNQSIVASSNLTDYTSGYTGYVCRINNTSSQYINFYVAGTSDTTRLSTILISKTFTFYSTGSSETASAVNEVNNSINNDNVTTSDADDFSNNQAFTDSTGLESVIQLPLNMVNSLTNTCQPIQITIPFINYTAEIPCMSTIYQSKFNALYTIVKIVVNGFFVYRLLLKIYELVHNAKQPDEDKLEVIDL